MLARQISPGGLALIQQFEGFEPTGYLPTGHDVPTAGWGHTGPDVQVGQTYSTAQCVEWLQQDVAWAEEAVTNDITYLPFTQHQFDACVSLCFNIGVTGFTTSSVARLLNMGNIQGAADAFLLWDKQHGTVLAGLVRRRQAERLWFLTPD